jgi:fumarylacetoacetate (FAA) hydrolase
MHYVRYSARTGADRAADPPQVRGGIRDGERVYDLARCLDLGVGRGVEVLASLVDPTLRAAWSVSIERWRGVPPDGWQVYAADQVTLHCPLAAAEVNSFRDFYAFEGHVKTARARRGLAMIPEWYELPVFYFSNHRVISGPGAVIPTPRYTQALDFELEVAAVIGRPGQDIAPEDAEAYIAGYTILNDWSARDVQRKEMAVGLGPAKGKDFATTLGPGLVTPDALADRRAGKGYDLVMTARRNGLDLSRGNWRDLYWSFGEMIARASDGVMLYPGDVIGSGTVGTGCILEIGPENAGGWLVPGDVIELEIERLGVLRNVIGDPQPSP